MLLSTFMWLFNISRTCECGSLSWGRLRTPFPTENTHKKTDVHTDTDTDAVFRCAPTHTQDTETHLLLTSYFPAQRREMLTRHLQDIWCSAVFMFNLISLYFIYCDLICTSVFALQILKVYIKKRSTVNPSSKIWMENTKIKIKNKSSMKLSYLK